MIINVDGKNVNKYVPAKKSTIPMNSEFIALIADKLQLQLKSAKVANF